MYICKDNIAATISLHHHNAYKQGIQYQDNIEKKGNNNANSEQVLVKSRGWGPSSSPKRKATYFMKLYTIEFTIGGTVHGVSVRARNKIEAVATGFSKLRGWRQKDLVDEIRIIEDNGNREATADDYKCNFS
jgi:hypothetical protein